MKISNSSQLSPSTSEKRIFSLAILTDTDSNTLFSTLFLALVLFKVIDKKNFNVFKRLQNIIEIKIEKV